MNPPSDRLPLPATPIGSGPLAFTPHAERETVLDELHARPFEPIRPPCRGIRFAFLTDLAQMNADADALRRFCADHRLGELPAGAKHQRIAFPGAVLRWGGVAFLFWYGARAFRAAWDGGAMLRAERGGGEPLVQVIATLALLTWLNPHVWLDTVVLIGSIASQYPGQSDAFGAAAAAASFVFFLSLGFGARLLAPLFARPRAWQVLDAIVGIIMWSIAARLALG